MARSGISKFRVQQARDALLARGEHPSIDAVRVELGNTGSRTTLHRYLRELSDEEGIRVDQEQCLSEPIKALIASLAGRLHEEASEVIASAQARHDTERQTQEAEIVRLTKELDAAQSRVMELDAGWSAERQAHETANANWQAERIRASEAAKENESLHLRLMEHERHLQSLEEKHRHARESLEHFRQAAKEQREQEQRRHEQQVQQLQAENRVQAQTLIVKQDAITHLSQEAARLAAELSDARHQLQDTLEQLQTQRQTADSLAVAHARLDVMHDQASGRLQAAEAVNRQLAEELRGTSTRLAESQLGRQQIQAQLDAQAALYADLQQQLASLIRPVADDAEGPPAPDV